MTTMGPAHCGSMVSQVFTDSLPGLCHWVGKRTYLMIRAAILCVVGAAAGVASGGSTAGAA